MVNKWEIYSCNLDPTTGSEQRGTRPVLVISNDAVNHNLPVSTVIPLSSVKEGALIYPTEVLLTTDVSSLKNTSVAMVQQIRTVSHKRLVKCLSIIKDEETKARLGETIRNYFEF